MIEPGYIIHSQNNESFIMHRSHKYIDKIKTSKGWRYIYKKSGAEARDKYRSLEKDARIEDSIKKYDTIDANRFLDDENYYKNLAEKHKNKGYEHLKEAGVKDMGNGFMSIPLGADLTKANREFDAYRTDTRLADRKKKERETYANYAKKDAYAAKEAKFKAEMAKNAYNKTPLGKLEKATEKGKAYLDKLKKKKGN